MSSIDKSAFQKELFERINSETTPNVLRKSNHGKLALPKNIIAQIQLNRQLNDQENKNEIRNFVDQKIISTEIHQTAEIEIIEDNDGDEDKEIGAVQIQRNVKRKHIIDPLIGN